MGAIAIKGDLDGTDPKVSEALSDCRCQQRSVGRDRCVMQVLNALQQPIAPFGIEQWLTAKDFERNSVKVLLLALVLNESGGVVHDGIMHPCARNSLDALGTNTKILNAVAARGIASHLRNGGDGERALWL